MGKPLQEILDTRGFLTVNQLVKYLQEYHPMRAVSYPTLQRYVLKGYFKAVKNGGQYRIPKEDIDWYAANGTEPRPKFGGASAPPLSLLEEVAATALDPVDDRDLPTTREAPIFPADDDDEDGPSEPPKSLQIR